MVYLLASEGLCGRGRAYMKGGILDFALLVMERDRCASRVGVLVISYDLAMICFSEVGFGMGGARGHDGFLGVWGELDSFLVRAQVLVCVGFLGFDNSWSLFRFVVVIVVAICRYRRHLFGFVCCNPKGFGDNSTLEMSMSFTPIDMGVVSNWAFLLGISGLFHFGFLGLFLLTCCFGFGSVFRTLSFCTDFI